MSNPGNRRTGDKRRAPLADAPEEKPPPHPWRIRFAKSVRDTDFQTLSSSAVEAARKAIDKKLKRDPQQYGEFLHRPLQGLYKLKTSAIRIVYHVDAEAREVWVLAIGDRRDIWQDEVGILKRWDAARREFRPDDVSTREVGKPRDR
jgi:mRNA-degrading endonuclease RelE of RelBE toxin-antitoxin system